MFYRLRYHVRTLADIVILSFYVVRISFYRLVGCRILGHRFVYYNKVDGSRHKVCNKCFNQGEEVTYATEKG